MTEIAEARTLVIRTFTRHPRPGSLAWPGLELMLATWLGIHRPALTIDPNGMYVIRCFREDEARLLVEWFGGTRRGKSVSGNVVDLTT